MDLLRHKLTPIAWADEDDNDKFEEINLHLKLVYEQIRKNQEQFFCEFSPKNNELLSVCKERKRKKERKKLGRKKR